MLPLFSRNDSYCQGKGFLMKQEFYNNKDFWAGMMLIGIGAAAIFIARDYRFGSTMRMGPGYFPSVLGGVLVLFGIYVMIMGLRSKEKFKSKWPLRPLSILSLSIIMFGVLMNYAGLIPALVVLIFGTAIAGNEFKFIEVLLLSMGLIGLSVAVFVWVLGLNFPLIKGF
jgi:hypothetical protein